MKVIKEANLVERKRRRTARSVNRDERNRRTKRAILWPSPLDKEE